MQTDGKQLVHIEAYPQFYLPLVALYKRLLLLNAQIGARYATIKDCFSRIDSDSAKQCVAEELCNTSSFTDIIQSRTRPDILA